MSNSAEYTSDQSMAIALRNKDMNVVSTLLTKAVFLAALGLYNPNKTHDVYGVGTPEMNTITMGAEHDPVRVGQSDLDGSYQPLIESVIQHDFKRMAWRDTVPTASVKGTSPTFTVTVDSNGGVTGITPSGGSGFSGAAPTLILVPAVGTYGHGAQLTAVMSGGTIASVTVDAPGIDYTTSAVVVVNAGYSEGELFNRPIFHPSEIKTVGYIFKNDIKSALRLAEYTDKDGDEALLDLTGNSIVKEVAQQALRIDLDTISGSPTSESTQMWDRQYGLLQAIDDGNTTAVYAGVDRSLADGSTFWWRSQVDTGSHTYDLGDLVDDANLKKGLSERSGGIDLVLCHPRMLAKWKKNGVAQQVNVNTSDKVREMAKYGFRSEVLQYGNAFAIGHPGLPVNTALAINTQSILFRFYNGNKFTPSQLWDLEGTDGGKEAHKFHVTTHWLWCIIPNLNAKYTNLQL
jgi:hypothetical protein